MNTITIDLNRLRANELAAIAASTSGLDRQAARVTLRNLIGRDAAKDLMDAADNMVNRLEMDAEHFRKMAVPEGDIGKAVLGESGKAGR